MIFHGVNLNMSKPTAPTSITRPHLVGRRRSWWFGHYDAQDFTMGMSKSAVWFKKLLKN